jgi:hypothetical protein
VNPNLFNQVIQNKLLSVSLALIIFGTGYVWPLHTNYLDLLGGIFILVTLLNLKNRSLNSLSNRKFEFLIIFNILLIIAIDIYGLLTDFNFTKLKGFLVHLCMIIFLWLIDEIKSQIRLREKTLVYQILLYAGSIFAFLFIAKLFKKDWINLQSEIISSSIWLLVPLIACLNFIIIKKIKSQEFSFWIILISLSVLSISLQNRYGYLFTIIIIFFVILSMKRFLTSKKLSKIGLFLLLFILLSLNQSRVEDVFVYVSEISTTANSNLSNLKSNRPILDFETLSQSVTLLWNPREQDKDRYFQLACAVEFLTSNQNSPQHRFFGAGPGNYRFVLGKCTKFEGEGFDGTLELARTIYSIAFTRVVCDYGLLGLSLIALILLSIVLKSFKDKSFTILFFGLGWMSLFAITDVSTSIFFWLTTFSLLRLNSQTPVKTAP